MALDSEEEDSDSDDEGLMEVDEDTLEAMAAAAGSASEEDSEEDAGSAGETTLGGRGRAFGGLCRQRELRKGRWLCRGDPRGSGRAGCCAGWFDCAMVRAERMLILQERRHRPQEGRRMEWSSFLT